MDRERVVTVNQSAPSNQWLVKVGDYCYQICPGKSREGANIETKYRKETLGTRTEDSESETQHSGGSATNVAIAEQYENTGTGYPTKATTNDDDQGAEAAKITICVEDDVAGLTFKTDAEIKEIIDWVNARTDKIVMSCDEVVYKFVIWLIMDLPQEKKKSCSTQKKGSQLINEDVQRVVKLGRKPLQSPVAHHWAIQVGERWYEITSKDHVTRRNAIHVNNGGVASSGAGKLGGEVVGKSTKTDNMIFTWLNIWLSLNPRYDLLSDNCQKLSYEFMVWVTNNNYLCDHRVDAANINTFDSEFRDVQGRGLRGFAATKGGNTVLHLNVGGNALSSKGPFNQRVKVGQFTGQAVAGPGLGVFVDTTVADVSFSAGNVAGFHVGLNANTGIGARNGNMEAHFLGFGGKIGADGVEVNTPIAGVNLCSIM